MPTSQPCLANHESEVGLPSLIEGKKSLPSQLPKTLAMLQLASMLDKRGVKPLVILVSLPPLTEFREARVDPALSRAGVVATFLPLS